MKKLYGHLPDSPGVYLMRNAAGRILYVGKAGNLRRRVSSYFARPHEYRIEKLVSEIARISYRKTDTAIEALIMEADLIKKHQPPYNVREKDDTSFLYVAITEEKFPRVLLTRGKEIEGRARGLRAAFGPFTSATSIRQALRTVRKIFPYSTHTAEEIMKGRSRGRRACFEYEIGLCPGTCAGMIDDKEYGKSIKNIIAFFRGKKTQIVRSLEREMNAASKKLEFEKAEKLKRQIFALQHIQDVAFITDERPLDPRSPVLSPRIEGYDISNISGTSAVGSMVVFRGKRPERSEYRKFKIRTIAGSDDVGMLREVLRRRFKRGPDAHGWQLPALILIDGGKPQVNAARRVLDECGFRIPVVGIAKGPERKRNDIVGIVPKGFDKATLVKVRDEAHRFAIQYHKKVRGGAFMR